MTENYMLQQMQQLAMNMTSLPQTGGSKDSGEGASFQDMIEKASEKSEKTEAGTETTGKPAEKKEPVSSEKPQPKDPKEELKAENVTANPNGVVYVDLFRPEIAPAAEETAAAPDLAEIPVETVEETPEMAVELPEMAAEETVEQPAVLPEEPQSEFRQAMEEAPAQEKEEEIEAPVEERQTEIQPERTEETRTVREELPEAEVKVVRSEEDADEPKAEMAEIDTPVFQDAKATPVKVGETYETVDTREPDMEGKLADTIQQAVQSGSERIEIRLAPQNLGELTIEMTKDVNGALQVVLHASNSRAAGVLNQHLNGLHAALQNYSQEPVRIEVQRGEESQEQNLHQQADPDGHGQNRQQQERREEHTGSGDFLQKMRLGLFGGEETL